MITKDSQRGFTMVEILVSLGVVTLFMIVMTAVIQNGFSINGLTTQRADAGALAFKKIQDYTNRAFVDIPIGDDLTSYEVEDFSSEAQAMNLAGAVAKFYIEPESVFQSTTTTTTTNFTQTIAADSAYTASGSEITDGGAENISGMYYRPWRITDDNYSNYTYNYFSPGADNKPLPSIDLQTPQTVGDIRIEWWSCNYRANDFRIEAKDSNPTVNSGWTTIVSGQSFSSAACSSDRTQDIDVSSNITPYRYWRMHVVDATHSTWNVISEFEAFSSGIPGDIVEQHGSDASSAPGELYFSSSDLEMSENGSRGQQSIGIIFDDIDTDQGATIDNAYIEFTADEADSGAVTLLVSGVDIDNAQAWSGSYAVDNAVDNDASDGSVGTSAKVTWTPNPWSAGENGSDTRVDVTAIVQELVDRAGWAVDNDMAFAIQYVSGASKRVAERSPAPDLVINWSESVTTTSTGIYEDADLDGDVDNPTLVRATAIIEYDAYGRRHKVEYSTFIRKFGIGD